MYPNYNSSTSHSTQSGNENDIEHDHSYCQPSTLRSATCQQSTSSTINGEDEGDEVEEYSDGRENESSDDRVENDSGGNETGFLEQEEDKSQEKNILYEKRNDVENMDDLQLGQDAKKDSPDEENRDNEDDVGAEEDETENDGDMIESKNEDDDDEGIKNDDSIVPLYKYGGVCRDDMMAHLRATHVFDPFDYYEGDDFIDSEDEESRVNVSDEQKVDAVDSDEPGPSGSILSSSRAALERSCKAKRKDRDDALLKEQTMRRNHRESSVEHLMSLMNDHRKRRKRQRDQETSDEDSFFAETRRQYNYGRRETVGEFNVIANVILENETTGRLFEKAEDDGEVLCQNIEHEKEGSSGENEPIDNKLYEKQVDNEEEFAGTSQEGIDMTRHEDVETKQKSTCDVDDAQEVERPGEDDRQIQPSSTPRQEELQQNLLVDPVLPELTTSKIVTRSTRKLSEVSTVKNTIQSAAVDTMINLPIQLEIDIASKKEEHKSSEAESDESNVAERVKMRRKLRLSKTVKKEKKKKTDEFDKKVKESKIIQKDKRELKTRKRLLTEDSETSSSRSYSPQSEPSKPFSAKRLKNAIEDEIVESKSKTIPEEKKQDNDDSPESGYNISEPSRRSGRKTERKNYFALSGNSNRNTKKEETPKAKDKEEEKDRHRQISISENEPTPSRRSGRNILRKNYAAMCKGGDGSKHSTETSEAKKDEGKLRDDIEKNEQTKPQTSKLSEVVVSRRSTAYPDSKVRSERSSEHRVAEEKNSEDGVSRGIVEKGGTSIRCSLRKSGRHVSRRDYSNMSKNAISCSGSRQ